MLCELSPHCGSRVLADLNLNGAYRHERFFYACHFALSIMWG